MELLSFPDKDGQEIAVLVIVAAFEIDSAGRAEQLEIQPEVRLTDEYFAEPASSSLRYEADVAVSKPAVDVIVNGSAYAPLGRPTSEVEASLDLADIHKRLIVLGDRKKLVGGIHSRPESFERMPIVYERAYGGADYSSSNPKRHKLYKWNPVGLGYRGVASADPKIESELPNINHARRGLKSSPKIPAGFAGVARSWSPRLELAGTYDEAWLEEQWPLLPRDFHDRHYQAAPSDQQSGVIKGGEEARLRNLTPQGDWRFRLPTLDIPLRLVYRDGIDETKPRLDTVLIEPDLARVTLTARLALPVRRQRLLREIVAGHMTRGWLRAKSHHKPYRDPSATRGVDHSRTYHS